MLILELSLLKKSTRFFRALMGHERTRCDKSEGPNFTASRALIIPTSAEEPLALGIRFGGFFFFLRIIFFFARCTRFAARFQLQMSKKCFNICIQYSSAGEIRPNSIVDGILEGYTRYCIRFHLNPHLVY